MTTQTENQSQQTKLISSEDDLTEPSESKCNQKDKTADTQITQAIERIRKQKNWRYPFDEYWFSEGFVCGQLEQKKKFEEIIRSLEGYNYDENCPHCKVLEELKQKLQEMI